MVAWLKKDITDKYLLRNACVSAITALLTALVLCVRSSESCVLRLSRKPRALSRVRTQTNYALAHGFTH